MSTYFFLSYPCHQFSNIIASKSLTIWPNYWLKPKNHYIITYLAIYLYRQISYQVSKFCPLGRYSITLSVREVTERE